MKNIITDYGATPGGSVDCTSAFAAATAVGGAIYVPGGNGPYLVSGAVDACIIARLPTRFIGDTMLTSQILVGGGTPSTVDGLTFRPTAGGVSDGWGMQDISIIPAIGCMRYAVRVDLSQAGAYLARATFQRVYLVSGATADAAFKLDNPANLDGLFCGEISGKGIIVGGIKLLNLGDSFSIKGQTITGPNVGIYLQAVPGSAQCKIEDNNITATGGAIFLQGLNQAQVIGNQCEQTVAYTGPFNAMVVLSDCVDCDVDANNLNPHGYTNCVVIENGGSRGNIISRNVMNSGPGFYHLMVGANCPGNALRTDNRCYNAAGVWGTPAISIDPTSPLWIL